MRFYQRYRYRNKVRENLDYIFHRVRPGISKNILVLAFGLNWRAAVNSMYGTVSPKEAAGTIAAMSLEGLVKILSPDQRAITLFALQSGNRSDAATNNFISIIDGIVTLCGEGALRQMALYTLAGALEGKFGEELTNYRLSKSLGEALDPYLRGGRQPPG